jgi:NAD(P)-dependent dehydrogenase (short-subunit alcohol dehydrogenase family)
LAFAEAGVKGVVFADIDDEAAKKVADESASYAKHAEYRALAIKVDMTDSQSVQDLVTTAVKEFGRIDYAVNSAGVSLSKTSRAIIQRKTDQSLHQD